MAGTFTGSIEQFKCQMASCVACDLAKYRKQTVFGDGVLNPTAMIIGEAPGEDEDAQGIPFVGKAGQQLTKMLTYAGLDRTKNAYIANTVLCRPPNNRTPLMEEMDACRERLFNQIDMVAPKFIVLLGRSAWSTIFQQELKKPLKLHLGSVVEVTIHNKQYKVVTAYHPSYHIRNRFRAYREALPTWNTIQKMVKELE